MSKAYLKCNQEHSTKNKHTWCQKAPLQPAGNSHTLTACHELFSKIQPFAISALGGSCALHTSFLTLGIETSTCPSFCFESLFLGGLGRTGLGWWTNELHDSDSAVVTFGQKCTKHRNRRRTLQGIVVLKQIKQVQNRIQKASSRSR